MNKFFTFIGIDGKSKFAFMSWIGGMFIMFYLLHIFYEMAQINYFFAKGKVPIEIYKEFVKDFHLDLKEVVMLIVVYFFAKNTNNQTPE